MSKYQYIIISVNEARLKKTTELLNKVNKNNAFVYNLKGITPDDDNNFLENIKNNFNILEKKTISCAKSHFNAIAYALRDESPEYSIILEDDVTFLKDNFSELVEEIIEKVDNNSKYENVQIIQIGWIPGNNYSKYVYFYDSIDNINKYNNDLLFLNSFYAFGLQGYIIRKNKINNFTNFKEIIETNNFTDCYNLLSKFEWFNTSPNFFAVDYVVNRLLNFITIFPPLIIERNENSLIDINNNMKYWDNYFKYYEYEKDKYLNDTSVNINTKYQYIIISGTEARKNKTNELLNKVNTSNAKVYNLKATYPEDNNEFYTCVKDKYNNKDQCVVCCVKSHLRALEYALDDNSPEYSIILEDDVTFLKEDFNDIVDELIIKMDNTDKLGMVHIGYVMHDSYYKFFNLEKSDKLNNYPELHLFNIMYAFGLQGYIVKKSKLNLIKEYIYSKDYNEYHNLINKFFEYNYYLYPIDHAINRILEFTVVYPPLIIERNEESTIGNINKPDWDKYFSKFPDQKNKYLV